MSDPEHAFVFIDNHDNQRGHGGGGDIIVSPLKVTNCVNNLSSK